MSTPQITGWHGVTDESGCRLDPPPAQGFTEVSTDKERDMSESRKPHHVRQRGDVGGAILRMMLSTRSLSRGSRRRRGRSRLSRSRRRGRRRTLLLPLLLPLLLLPKSKLKLPSPPLLLPPLLPSRRCRRRRAANLMQIFLFVCLVFDVLHDRR